MRRSKSYEVRDPMNIWNKYDFAMSGLGKKSKILAKIKHFFKCVKWSKQRITRGYCDCDVWEMFSFLQTLIPDMLQTLKDTRTGSSTGKLVIRDGRKLRRYKEMEPMYLQVLQKETGRQIKKLLVENGYTVKDVQNAMGFENPQAVYKWISGRSLPSLDNFVILSRLLHTSIEDILVIDGDIVRLWGFSFKLLVQ